MIDFNIEKNIYLIDTHVHLYAREFDLDRNDVINNALKFGIKKFYLPSIDSTTLNPILLLESNYPKICMPMIGLHPNSVHPSTIKFELDLIEKWLDQHLFYAIGEIGIDLYLNKIFLKEQKDAFYIQIRLAKKKLLPIIIHSRCSFNEIFKILEKEKDDRLYGIIHCFSGTFEEAKIAISYGMKLGIGGMITFKNNKINQFLDKIDIKHIVLETDAPYLTPVPYRGRRNEPIYLNLILEKLSHIYSMSKKKIAEITTKNAFYIFSKY